MKNNNSIIIWRNSASVAAFIAQMNAIGYELTNDNEDAKAITIDDKEKIQPPIKTNNDNDEKTAKTTIISDREELENLKKKNTELAGYIFILVEIDWYSYGSFQGLEIAKELMEHYGKGKVLNIHFVSFMTRASVMKNNTDELLTIARQFQNIQLPLLHKQIIPLITYSRNLYQLYWNNIFNAAFLYNLLGHNIKKLNPSSVFTDFENTILLLKKYIASYKTPGIISSVHNLKLNNKAFKANDAYEKIQKIQNLLALEVAKLGKLPGFTNQTNYKVVIVDDNISDTNNLKNILEGYFDVQDNFLFSNGETAVKFLNNYKNEKIYAVFLDQELLDTDGGYQPVQGLDLYELLSTPKYKGLQLRIITSLSREAISMMYPDNLQIDKVLFKENGGYSVSQDNLHKFFENLYDDISEGLNDELDGPKTGHFDARYGLKQLYYDIDETQAIEDIIERVKDTTSVFLTGRLSKGAITTTTKKDKTILDLSKDDKKILPRDAFVITVSFAGEFYEEFGN